MPSKTTVLEKAEASAEGSFEAQDFSLEKQEIALLEEEKTALIRCRNAIGEFEGHFKELLKARNGDSARGPFGMCRHFAWVAFSNWQAATKIDLRVLNDVNKVNADEAEEIQLLLKTRRQMKSARILAHDEKERRKYRVIGRKINSELRVHSGARRLISRHMREQRLMFGSQRHRITEMLLELEKWLGGPDMVTGEFDEHLKEMWWGKDNYENRRHIEGLIEEIRKGVNADIVETLHIEGLVKSELGTKLKEEHLKQLESEVRV